jgi:hypothetical protein
VVGGRRTARAWFARRWPHGFFGFGAEFLEFRRTAYAICAGAA